MSLLLVSCRVYIITLNLTIFTYLEFINKKRQSFRSFNAQMFVKNALVIESRRIFNDSK